MMFPGNSRLGLGDDVGMIPPDSGQWTPSFHYDTRPLSQIQINISGVSQTD